jgi:heme/copper-type cytochrome/quinol oxidase subunit 2
MRHLAFYYAIGFAVTGCLMLAAYLSTFISMMSNNYDPYVTGALGIVIILPFVIAMFSWRCWREIERNKKTEGGPENEGP